MKKCKPCGVTKPNAAFNKNRARSTGLQDWCRECSRGKFGENTKRYNLRKYKLSLEDFHALLTQANNTCFICLRQFTETLFPCVDHDKETGKVRNVLCSNCNVAIGFLAHDAERAERATEYIRRFC
jgi:hypothetical protein